MHRQLQDEDLLYEANNVRPSLQDFLERAKDKDEAEAGALAAAATAGAGGAATVLAGDAAAQHPSAQHEPFRASGRWAFNILQVLLAPPYFGVAEKHAIRGLFVERLATLLTAWWEELRSGGQGASDTDAAAAAAIVFRAAAAGRKEREKKLKVLLLLLLKRCPTFGKLPQEQRLQCFVAQAPVLCAEAAHAADEAAFLRLLLQALDEPHVCRNHMCCGVCSVTEAQLSTVQQSKTRRRPASLKLFECSKCVTAVCPRCLLVQSGRHKREDLSNTTVLTSKQLAEARQLWEDAGTSCQWCLAFDGQPEPESPEEDSCSIECPSTAQAASGPAAAAAMASTLKGAAPTPGLANRALKAHSVPSSAPSSGQAEAAAAGPGAAAAVPPGRLTQSALQQKALEGYRRLEEKRTHQLHESIVEEARMHAPEGVSDAAAVVEYSTGGGMFTNLINACRSLPGAQSSEMARAAHSVLDKARDTLQQH